MWHFLSNWALSGSWNIHKDSDSEIWKDLKGTVDEGLKDRKENVAGGQKKGRTCYIQDGNLDGTVTCNNVEKERVPNNLMDLARAICRQNVKGAKWLLLAAYCKIRVEMNYKEGTIQF